MPICPSIHALRSRRWSPFAALALVAPAAQEPVRLNAPLPSATSAVDDFELDPSGSYAVYVADQERPGVRELYRVPLDLAAASVRLNAPLPPAGDVLVAGRPNLSIGGGRVVYRADAVVDDAFELFSVPLDGGQAEVRLSAQLVSGGDVGAFALTPDGSRVVYLADQDTDEVREVHVAPIDGSEPARRLHEPFARRVLATRPGRTLREIDAERFWISSDGERVVYAVQERESSSAGFFALYSVPIDAGSPPTLLARAPFPAFSSLTVHALEFSPDGQWMAYLQQFVFSPITSTTTLYLQRTDGTEPRTLLAAGGGCCGGGVGKQGFTPDGERVLWSWSSGNDGSAPAHHLFSAERDGIATPLDEPLQDTLSAMVVSPGGDSVFALYSNSGAYRTSTDGSFVPLLLGASSHAGMAQLSHNQSRLVFGRNGLNSLSTAGGDPAELAPPISNSILSFRLLPDDRGVVFETEVALGRHELRYAPIEGSFPARALHPALPAGGTVAVEFNVDRPLFRLVGSRAVAFRATLASANTMELWLTPFVRGGPVRNTPTAPGTAPSVRVP